TIVRLAWSSIRPPELDALRPHFHRLLLPALVLDQRGALHIDREEMEARLLPGDMARNRLCVPPSPFRVANVTAPSAEPDPALLLYVTCLIPLRFRAAARPHS